MRDDHYTVVQLRRWAEALHEGIYAKSLEEGMVTQVAITDDDRPVAFCSWLPDEIKGLYVDPAFQGKGVGRDLLARAEDALKANGVDRSRIASTLGAAGFYAACGYRLVERGEHETHGGDILPVAVMEKALA